MKYEVCLKSLVTEWCYLVLFGLRNLYLGYLGKLGRDMILSHQDQVFDWWNH